MSGPVIEICQGSVGATGLLAEMEHELSEYERGLLLVYNKWRKSCI